VTSPQRSRERAAEGSLNPATGAVPDMDAAPGRGRAPGPAGGALDADAAPPAGSSGAEERAAQREEWRRVQASYRRGRRGEGWRRRAARGTLPARAGMNRKPTPGRE